MEDLELYLRDIVEPTIDDFENDPTSVRKAFLACVAMCHAVDYLAHPRKPGNLRRDWKRQCPSFSIVDLVAHAFKHVKSDGIDRVFAADVIPRPPMVWCEAQLDLSRWGDPEGGVTLNRDRAIDLRNALKASVVFAHSQLRPTR